MWICDEFLELIEDYGVVIVYGYMVEVYGLVFCYNCIGVDIGVYWIGWLVVFGFEGEDWWVVDV